VKSKREEFEMLRLISNFRKMPSPSNRAKLQNYIRKHEMAVCMLAPDETNFLRIHGFEGI
jgi:hypothetical protein